MGKRSPAYLRRRERRAAAQAEQVAQAAPVLPATVAGEASASFVAPLVATILAFPSGEVLEPPHARVAWVEEALTGASSPAWEARVAAALEGETLPEVELSTPAKVVAPMPSARDLAHARMARPRLGDFARAKWSFKKKRPVIEHALPRILWA